MKAVSAATADGLVEPRTEDFVGSVYRPPYHPNYSYLAYTAEGRVTDFEFQADDGPTIDNVYDEPAYAIGA